MKKILLYILLINLGALAGILVSWALAAPQDSLTASLAAFVCWPILLVISISGFFSYSLIAQICLGLGILLFVMLPFVNDEWRYAQVTASMVLLNVKVLAAFNMIMSV